MNVPFPFVIDDNEKELENWTKDYQAMGHR